MDAAASIASSGGNPHFDQLRELLHDSRLSEQQKLAETARQFEGILVRDFLKDALEPLIEGTLDEGGSAHGIYRQFMTDALSDSITRGISFGFSNVLQQQMASATPPGEPRNPDHE